MAKAKSLVEIQAQIAELQKVAKAIETKETKLTSSIEYVSKYLKAEGWADLEEFVDAWESSLKKVKKSKGTNHRLTSEEKEQVKKLLTEEVSVKDIADKFKISEGRVSQLKSEFKLTKPRKAKE